MEDSMSQGSRLVPPTTASTFYVPIRCLWPFRCLLYGWKYLLASRCEVWIVLLDHYPFYVFLGYLYFNLVVRGICLWLKTLKICNDCNWRMPVPLSFVHRNWNWKAYSLNKIQVHCNSKHNLGSIKLIHYKYWRRMVVQFYATVAISNLEDDILIISTIEKFMNFITTSFSMKMVFDLKQNQRCLCYYRQDRPIEVQQWCVAI